MLCAAHKPVLRRFHCFTCSHGINQTMLGYDCTMDSIDFGSKYVLSHPRGVAILSRAEREPPYAPSHEVKLWMYLSYNL